MFEIKCGTRLLIVFLLVFWRLESSITQASRRIEKRELSCHIYLLIRFLHTDSVPSCMIVALVHRRVWRRLIVAQNVFRATLS